MGHSITKHHFENSAGISTMIIYDIEGIPTTCVLFTTSDMYLYEDVGIERWQWLSQTMKLVYQANKPFTW